MEIQQSLEDTKIITPIGIDQIDTEAVTELWLEKQITIATFLFTLQIII